MTSIFAGSRAAVCGANCCGENDAHISEPKRDLAGVWARERPMYLASGRPHGGGKGGTSDQRHGRRLDQRAYCDQIGIGRQHPISDRASNLAGDPRVGTNGVDVLSEAGAVEHIAVDYSCEDSYQKQNGSRSDQDKTKAASYEDKYTIYAVPPTGTRTMVGEEPSVYGTRSEPAGVSDRGGWLDCRANHPCSTLSARISTTVEERKCAPGTFFSSLW